MAFGLYSLLEAAILCLNAVCVLHEERFLAKNEIEKERSLSHALAKFHLVKPSIQLSLDMCLHRLGQQSGRVWRGPRDESSASSSGSLHTHSHENSSDWNQHWRHRIKVGVWIAQSTRSQGRL